MTLEQAQIVRDRCMHYRDEHGARYDAVVRPAHAVPGERITGYVVHYRDSDGHRRCVHDADWRPYDHAKGTHVLEGITEYTVRRSAK